MTVEALEDRTLLSGNVLVGQDVGTGVVQIMGDNGDNQFTLAPSPTNPTRLRIAGKFDLKSPTAINSATFFEIPISSITSISDLE